MQSVDLQIAAIALCLGNCTVVSKDSDLRRAGVERRELGDILTGCEEIDSG